MNRVDNVIERIDGYHGRYTDKYGASCSVKGTFALGAALSWYNENGDYMVICGHDQSRIVKGSN